MKELSVEAFAREVRVRAVEMVARAKASHLGGALSMTDILAHLYSEVMNTDPAHPNDPKRDRFILSKGHCCSALYAALAIKGFFPEERLLEYGVNGSGLMAHASHSVPGVELSTGSLGHGLPVGCGKALAAKRKQEPWRVFVMLSDGEMDEGSNWEAVLFAAHHRLDNLVAIIDFNKIQSLGNVQDVMGLEPLDAKFRAFGWEVKTVDGHDHDQLRNAFSILPLVTGKPSLILAHTRKGAGVSFMENELLWHYKSPDSSQVSQALKELRGEGKS